MQRMDSLLGRYMAGWSRVYACCDGSVQGRVYGCYSPAGMKRCDGSSPVSAHRSAWTDESSYVQTEFSSRLGAMLSLISALRIGISIAISDRGMPIRIR